MTSERYLLALSDHKSNDTIFYEGNCVYFTLLYDVTLFGITESLLYRYIQVA